jgi:signal peptidase I
MIPYFSLRKPKRTLRHIHRLYNRKAKNLDTYTKESIQEYLTRLQGAIIKKDAPEAKRLSKELEQLSMRLMPKGPLEKVRDFISGMAVALLVAVLIRTMWFELYTIPTGSMRPTLKEEDYLIVSKTDYGINVPLQEAHFYFDPDLVQRGSIIVFNGANMDIDDVDTMYFYLFPGKKQFVKRLIGKPGDTIYFYGGQIYGLDAAGQEITELRKLHLEHIPYIRFDGKAETPNAPKGGVFSPVLFHQMNQPVAKLSISPIGTITGEMLATQRSYSDLWGMKHFAMARLLTRSQMEQLHPNALKGLEEGILYLELTHHPTLQGAQLIRDEQNRLRPELKVHQSFLPLQEKHLQALAEHMTTCRFSVKNGVAWRFGWNPGQYTSYLPKLNIPDGTYEIQDGQAVRLPFPRIPILGLFTNGITQRLPSDHPLYQRDPETVQKLFNLGIEFLNQYTPMAPQQRAMPSRYAYFREGDLYLFNAPIVKRDDPLLRSFIQQEQEKQSIATTVHPYAPFIDQGPPSLEEIRKNGLRIPEKMYLALGDNHAMSADSRQFGFVPEDNLKGGVSFIFLPPGDRFGQPPQPAQPHLTLPNVTVWCAFLLIAAAYSLYYRRKLRNPLQF